MYKNTQSKTSSSEPNAKNSVKTAKVPAAPTSSSLKRRNSALVNNQGFLAVPFGCDSWQALQRSSYW